MGLRSFLFGSGKVRIEFTDVTGRTGAAKVPYEGRPDNAEQILSHFRKAYAVEYGTRIKEARIVAWVHQ